MIGDKRILAGARRIAKHVGVTIRRDYACERSNARYAITTGDRREQFERYEVSAPCARVWDGWTVFDLPDLIAEVMAENYSGASRELDKLREKSDRIIRSRPKLNGRIRTHEEMDNETREMILQGRCSASPEVMERLGITAKQEQTEAAEGHG